MNKKTRTVFRPSEKDKTRAHKRDRYSAVHQVAEAPLPVDTWHRFIFVAHSFLHRKGSHSPIQVEKKYNSVERKFYRIHFGSYRASMRYLNKYSCHSFL